MDDVHDDETVLARNERRRAPALTVHEKPHPIGIPHITYASTARNEDKKSTTEQQIWKTYPWILG